ncbi:MAG: AAA family ATPase [Candidatus Marinimicrobia bacterium]|nr:AAA family ATPase [Candidatus Neomarinimicrobiota bacterium]
MTEKSSHQLDRICQAMADPDFYSHSTEEIEKKETNISVVFLTGDWVYKLKKPVELGFLDFSTLEQRKKYCEQEIRLNKRLTSGVYEGVLPIGRSDDSFALGKEKDVAEYVVKMRQLKYENTLKYRLQKGDIEEQQLSQLGKFLAEFYLTADVNQKIKENSGSETVQKNVLENFYQTEEYVDDLIDPDMWQILQSVSQKFLNEHWELFQRRVDNEYVRDGHGDLRAEHIYFEEPLQIIDCIEFNRRFRYLDPASDLAYLFIDLEKLKKPDEALTILSTYVKEAYDPSLYRLIDFYATYRAMVRVKVNCFKSDRTDESEKNEIRDTINHHLKIAYRHSLNFSTPKIYIFCGLPASGKTTLAERMSKFFDTDRISSDGTRREIADMISAEPGVQEPGEGIYREGMKNRVYGRMAEKTLEQLREGKSVVLDASFSNKRWRDMIRQLADKEEAKYLFIECKAPQDHLKERLKSREKKETLSDARIQHLESIRNDFENFSESEQIIQIDTTQKIKDSFLDVTIQTFNHFFKAITD